MTLDQVDIGSQADDASSVLVDDTAVLSAEDGGSAELKRLADATSVRISQNTLTQIRDLLLFFVGGVLDRHRADPNVIDLLRRSNGSIETAAAIVIGENGIPAAISKTALELNRTSGGWGTDCRPQVVQLLAVVMGHLSIKEE